MDKGDNVPVNKRYALHFIQSGKLFLFSSLLTLTHTKANDIILTATTSYSNLAIYNVALTLSFAWTFIPLSIGTSYLTRAIETKIDDDFVNLHRYMLISSLPILIGLYFCLILLLNFYLMRVILLQKKFYLFYLYRHFFLR